MFDWRVVLGLTLAFMIVYGISYVLYYKIWAYAKEDSDEDNILREHRMPVDRPAYNNVLLQRRKARSARKKQIAKGEFDYAADRERRAKHEA